MVNVSVARRYARALLEVAADGADQVLGQLDTLTRLMDESPELKGVFTNPAFTREQRSQVVETLVQRLGGLAEPLANFLRLLVDRDRLGFLPDIARVYRDLADSQAGRVRGQLISAAPLPAELLTRMQRSLEQLTRREVVLEAKVDPAVVGGVAAQVGSVVYDGTLRTQLQGLARTLR